MAIKRFCDTPGCEQEVTDYPVSGYVQVGGVDFKVTIELAAFAESEDDESGVDLCNDCFWRAVNKLNTCPPRLTDVVQRPHRDRHAI